MGAVESNVSVCCILWESSQGQQTAGQMLCLVMAAKLQAVVVWHLRKKPRDSLGISLFDNGQMDYNSIKHILYLFVCLFSP